MAFARPPPGAPRAELAFKREARERASEAAARPGNPRQEAWGGRPASHAPALAAAGPLRGQEPRGLWVVRPGAQRGRRVRRNEFKPAQRGRKRPRWEVSWKLGFWSAQSGEISEPAATSPGLPGCPVSGLRLDDPEGAATNAAAV